MATPEGKVKVKVSALLKKHGAYYEMPVPSGFGKSGLDYNGCFRGHYFAVETKAGNKQPTPRQALTISQIEAAGGKCFVINEETGTSALEWWLSNM